MTFLAALTQKLLQAHKILLAAGDRAAKNTLYDATNMKLQPVLPPLLGHTLAVTTLTFGPNGKTLLSSGYDLASRMWSVESGRQVGIMRSPDFFNSVNFLPSHPSKRRILMQKRADYLTIHEVNMLDPDLPWMRQGN